MVNRHLVIAGILIAAIFSTSVFSAPRGSDSGRFKLWGDAAHQPIHTRERHLLADNGEGISAGEAARMVQRRTGGKVLRVETQGEFYKVRVLLPNGVVKTFTVNKTTGGMG
ncbi:hypothetical protein BTA51_04545 [Hahella sp. CCB-MM4]|uniref:PepSY domain-containing protein n=1 Tax=Hahella sp. (strain CCB-MM4) TaxID=1926491 RepID=UPI000B9BA3E2|nr:hypothetical protein [Hahella sp. CCB-MM4]OZG74288.1 hypothetical protein BTA51_04545 [Hahella sp. CCB-MM4]